MGKLSASDQPNLLRRSLLAGGAAAVLAPRSVLAQVSNGIRIGVPTKTYWPTIICETAIAPEAVRKGRHQGRADDLSQRRGRLRGHRGGRRRPDPQLLLERRRRAL